ncbi:hypothetical protein FRC02_007574 [Tulasnella sp. 418]|nr:hypothetical protein FRC02_007574 [Tulasnella sp. 418]
MPSDSMDSTGWASPWAGANWFPSLNRDPENRWEKISWEKFKSNELSQFVMDLPTKYYRPSSLPEKVFWFKDIVHDFKVLEPPYPLPIGKTEPIGTAVEFTTISINTAEYLQWLQEELTKRGVKFVRGHVGSLEDVEYVPGTNGKVLTDIVVNASGLGAKSILGVQDEAVHPIRGQTVLVRAPLVKWCLMGTGLYVNKETKETTYIIPRNNGDVVVGGTFQEGNWDVRYAPRPLLAYPLIANPTSSGAISPDPEVTRGMLMRALQYCPELSSAPPTSDNKEPDISTIKVLRYNVGLRPGRRGGARLEKEIVTLPLETSKTTTCTWSSMPPPIPNVLENGQSINADNASRNYQRRPLKVIHAYGIGSAGYQASWGMAEDVDKLVKEILGEAV